jgi:hypothetical protein
MVKRAMDSIGGDLGEYTEGHTPDAWAAVFYKLRAAQDLDRGNERQVQAAINVLGRWLKDEGVRGVTTAPKERERKLVVPKEPEEPEEKIQEEAGKAAAEALQLEPPVKDSKKFVDYGGLIKGSRLALAGMSREEMSKNPVLARKLVTKANVFGDYKDFAALDKEAGIPPSVAWMKRHILDEVAGKPGAITKDPALEADLRHYYREGATRLLDGLARCRTEEDITDFLQEWQDAAEGKAPLSPPFKPEAWLVGGRDGAPLEHEITTGGEISFSYKGEKLTLESDPKILHAAWASIGPHEMLHNVWVGKTAGAHYSTVSRQRAFAAVIGFKEVVEKEDGTIQIVGPSVGKELYGQYTIALGDRFAQLVNLGVKRRRGVPSLTKYQGYDYGSYKRTFVTVWRQGLEEHAKTEVKDWSWASEEKKPKGKKAKSEMKEIKKTDKRWVWTRSTGEAKRTGPGVKAPADSAEFAKSFGFPQVNYGSWANEAEREWHVTSAHEALHDLARVMGIDPKVLGINGRLKMAFGARGTGGQRAPAAHYEPGGQVINLTKLSGAGSLAHEWGHFLDNAIMLGTVGQVGSKASHLTEHVDTSTRHGTGDRKVQGLARRGVPQEIAQAMTEVMRAIKVKPETAAEKQKRIDKVQRQRAEIRARLTPLKQESQSMRRIFSKLPWKEQQAVRQAWMDKNEVKTEVIATNPPPGGWKDEDKIPKPDTSGVTADQIELYAAIRGAMDRYNDTAAEFNALQGADVWDLPTDHYQEAMNIGGTYYSADVELFARSFESYVEDKLHESGQENTYLVAGTRAMHMAGGDRLIIKAPEPGIYIDPKHPDRARVTAAMDKLIAALREADQFRKALDPAAWFDSLMEGAPLVVR